MNKFFNILFLIIFLNFWLASCTKNTEKFTPYTTAELNDISWSSRTQMPLAKHQAIISALSKQDFTNSFNAAYSDTISINSQLQLMFPANSCLLNGINFLGNVNTSLKQLTSKGDFIRNLTSSCNSNKLYDSKGLFLLSLKDDNSKNITLTNGSEYDLSLVDSNILQGYEYIAGSTNAANPDSIYWALADSLDVGYLVYSSILFNGQFKKAYQIKSKALGWINIAAPIKSMAVTWFNVVLGVSNFTNKNTAVFAVFKDFNTVIKLKSDVASKTFFAENIPVGANINLVSISYIDGLFYLGSQAITVANAIQYSLKSSVVPVSIAGVNAFLEAL